MMLRFTEPLSLVRERLMEAHRRRRTRDQARKAWYAYYRQVRFARWFGFIGGQVKPDEQFVDAARKLTNVVSSESLR